MCRRSLYFDLDKCTQTAPQLPGAKLLASLLVSFCSAEMDEFVCVSFKAIATVIFTRKDRIKTRGVHQKLDYRKECTSNL